MARLLADGGAVIWGMSLLRYRWEGMSINDRVVSVHLDHYCPGGAGLPVTGSGPIGLGPADPLPAGAEENSARPGGQSCSRCEQPIAPRQDARRRIGGAWVHESCPG
jgi:hypothetical protein